VEVLDLRKEALSELLKQDPTLGLALNELLAYFQSLVLQHAAQQLSEWHSLVFAGQTS